MDGGGDARPAPQVEANGFFDLTPPQADRSPPSSQPASQPSAPPTTEGKAGAGKPADGADGGTDAPSLAGFLGMDPSTADATLKHLQGGYTGEAGSGRPAPPPSAQQSAQTPSDGAIGDDQVNELIEELALSDKAAPVFRALVGRVNELQAGQPQQQQPAAMDAQVAQASTAGFEAFSKTIDAMDGVKTALQQPVLAKAFNDAAVQIAGAINAQTPQQFEQALNMALYHVLPDKVSGHFKSEGREEVKGALQRRQGLLDATTQQTGSPSSEGGPSTNQLLEAYRSGKSIRNMLGV